MTPAQQTQLAAAYQLIVDDNNNINKWQSLLNSANQTYQAGTSNGVYVFNGQNTLPSALMSLIHEFDNNATQARADLVQHQKAYDVLQSSINESDAAALASQTTAAQLQAQLAATKAAADIAAITPPPATTLAQSNTQYLIYGGIALVIIVIAVLVLRKKYGK